MVQKATRSIGRKVARRGTTLLAALIIPLAGCAAGSVAGQSTGPVPSEMSSVTTSARVLTPAASTPSSTRRSSAPSSATLESGTPSTPDTGPKAIEGITWLLSRAVIGGKTYSSPQPPGSSVYGSYTMQFVSGRLLANDACNTVGAPVAVDAHRVTLSGEAGGSMVLCTSSTLREAYHRDVLQGSAAWAVSGGRLTLTKANGDTFEFGPVTGGYPSDLAGDKHATTPEKSVDGVRFRIYARPLDSGGQQCLTMEFDAPAGTPWEPVSICRDNLAAQYVVNPTDFTSGRLPSGTEVLFSAVPDGSTSRIVFRPTNGGAATELTLTPLPNTKFQAFYGFVEHPKGGGIVTFYDAKGVAYQAVWKVSF